MVKGDVGTPMIDYVFDLSPDMIAAFDFEGRFVRLNAAWTQVLGYTREQLEGRSFLPLIHPDDRETAEASLVTLAEGQAVLHLTNRCQTAGGSYRWIEWRAKTARAEGVIYTVARDQTDRRLLERQLRQAQAIGQRVGGIAHDFNNLLTAIIGFAEMMQAELSADDPRRDDVQQILNAGHSAAVLNRQLRTFSRQHIPT